MPNPTIHVPDHIAREVNRVDKIAEGRAAIAAKVRIETSALVLGHLMGVQFSSHLAAYRAERDKYPDREADQDSDEKMGSVRDFFQANQPDFGLAAGLAVVAADALLVALGLATEPAKQGG